MKKVKVFLSFLSFLVLSSLGLASTIRAQAYCPGDCNELYCEPVGVDGCWDCACNNTYLFCPGTEDEHGDCDVDLTTGCEQLGCTPVPCPGDCCITYCDPIESPAPDGGDGGDGDGADGGASPVASPSTMETISGTVNILGLGAETELVGGVCQLSSGTASGGQPGAGTMMTVSGATSNVGVDGDWSVSVTSAISHIAYLTLGDPLTYRCECPSSCNYGGVPAPYSGLNYYVTDQQESWFQTIGGNVHADGGNVTSNIPASCSGACDPYLITGTTPGLVSYTGSLDLGDFGEEGINETGDEWRADTDFMGIETDYGYFYRILADDPSLLGVFDGSEPGESGVFEGDGSSSTIGSWSITGGQKTVILADNDILIDENISVDTNSFLAIISSGSITIDDDVTNVEGVFVADNLIKTCNSGSDVQLLAEGVFVGWNGVNLCRDFYSLLNNTNPSELFVYRPDLQTNAYDYLMRPYYFWQEVAP